MASPAPACKQALADATHRWPKRSKASDGIMGDARHQKRKSDHNVGNAVDVTHDPKHGCHGDTIASYALKDSRTKYVIWNRRINSLDGRGWRKYTGSNPHTHHCHISIKSSARNNTKHWGWRGGGAAPPPPHNGGGGHAPTPAPPSKAPKYPGHPIKMGDRGKNVRTIQARLKQRGWTISVDGDFGPKTRAVVKKFQQRKGLTPDGIVGPFTWRALWK